MRCEHRFEILDVIRVVGWDDEDLAVPCLLEVNQCVDCGVIDESVQEDNVDSESDSAYEMAEW